MTLRTKPEKSLRRRPDQLGAKAKAFIREYCLCLNTAEAQRKVGYEVDRGNAARILNDPRAASEIKRHARKAHELAEIHQAWMMANVKKICGLNVFNQLQYDENNTLVGIDVRKMSEDQIYAVQEIGFDADGRPRLKFHDKLVAHKLLKDWIDPPKGAHRVKLEGNGPGGAIEVIDGLGARLNAARQRLKNSGS
jgi:Terminase small subunit